MSRGGPAVEGERRGEHPPVADRHQLGHPGRCLALRAVRRGRAAAPAAPRRHAILRGTAARALRPTAARSAMVRWSTLPLAPLPRSAFSAVTSVLIALPLDSTSACRLRLG